MKAFITGITGQDGSYLADFLLEKGYEVWGMVRRHARQTFPLPHISNDVHIVEGDMLDEGSLFKIIAMIKPDEVYNLAAQSFVPASWGCPMLTSEVTGFGVLRLLSAIQTAHPSAKFYQASSSEMYGKVLSVRQSETTPFNPQSPYAIAKLYAHYMTVNYRTAADMYAVSGILFNHESPRRGPDFVTRKITMAVARIKKNLSRELYLGNMNAKRDWGFAGDYVQAMWLMLQQDRPDDYVIATGRSHSVQAFAKLAFECVGLNYLDYVHGDSNLDRPNEVDTLLGNFTKARRELDWKPQINFEQLVEMMVKADIDALS